MNVEITTKIRVELQNDDPIMMDIINISKHDGVSEQEALTRSLKIFYPEVSLRPDENFLTQGVFTPAKP